MFSVQCYVSLCVHALCVCVMLYLRYCSWQQWKLLHTCMMLCAVAANCLLTLPKRVWFARRLFIYLFICLLATSHKKVLIVSLWKFYQRRVSLNKDVTLNFRSPPDLDPDPVIFWQNFFTVVVRDVLHIRGCVLCSICLTWCMYNSNSLAWSGVCALWMLFLNLRINYFKLFFNKLKDDQSFATFEESFTLCYYAPTNSVCFCRGIWTFIFHDIIFVLIAANLLLYSLRITCQCVISTVRNLFYHAFRHRAHDGCRFLYRVLTFQVSGDWTLRRSPEVTSQ